MGFERRHKDNTFLMQKNFFYKSHVAIVKSLGKSYFL